MMQLLGLVIVALSTINEAFQALFYGDGSWLGILLMLTLIIGLLLKWKYSGILLFPVTLFLGLDYIAESLNWHAAIMFFATCFMLFVSYKKIKG